ncbi:MAG: aminotransferase class V-fold PLP-dependent enzyme [Hyphomonadaceae bacterium]|nr:aminotransferase class V-fold PLP-dependent enzyme [Hyphomonadaceae bacterium]
MTPTKSIGDQRHLFDLPRDVAYLNCAYMGPMMRQAAELCAEGARRKLQPWRLSSADFFDQPERVRSLFAQLVNGDADGVAIVPSASYGITIAARNLPAGPGREILVLADQFPSNVYPWRKLAAQTGARITTVTLSPDMLPTESVLNAVTENTAIIAVPNALWTNGALLDLAAIGRRAREVGAALVVDASQSIGAMPFDAAEIQPDILITATYKWILGPYNMALAWIAPKWRDGEPVEETWLGRAGSENFARLIDYTDVYQTGARRFDVGERSNFTLMPALIATLEQLLDWGVDAISATLSARNAALARRLGELGFTCPEEPWRAPHYLTARAPAGAPGDLLTRLTTRNVHVSQRGEHLRITPHLYNDAEDEARLLHALAEMI